MSPFGVTALRRRWNQYVGREAPSAEEDTARRLAQYRSRLKRNRRKGTK